MRLNPVWCKAQQEKIDQARDPHCVPFTITVDLNLAAKFIIVRLNAAGLPFRVFNLGAGVKKITTETDTCPCCKRKL